MQKRILIAFDDPGGGLAVSSLLERLNDEKNLSLEIYSGKLSEKFLKDRNISFKKLQSKITNQDAIKIIDSVMPDIILTGTSGGNAEQELRNIAFERKISSVVILDFWKDYSRRWLYSSYPVEEMRDRVCVMDKLTKSEMVNEKFPEENLMITGHPYLDKIFNYEKSGMYADSKNSGSHNYLFLSQPLHIIGIKNHKENPVKFLIEALKKLAEIRNVKITLRIKLHPSEEMGSELSDLSESDNRDLFEIIFTDESKSLLELINEAEAVIGYNSIAMFESRAAGKRTISLNIVPVKNSLLIAMDEAGIENVPGSTEEIFNCLSREEINFEENKIFSGGIKNCLKVILEQLN